MPTAIVQRMPCSIAAELFDCQTVTGSSTANLTRAIASGDTEAFARFYRAWFDRMFVMARQCTGRDESFCLDVVQDSMVRVIRSIPELNTDVELERWLHVVVRSCALDRLRRERRRSLRERRSDQTTPKATSARDDQDGEDRIAWLRKQLSQLPPEQAHLLSLRYRLGWTLARIGRALGIKPGAVDGRINRTIKTLQAHATEDFRDEQ